jgi:pentatricopeptide repeat protein
MRYLIFLLLLCSCSGARLVHRAERLYERAQKKGVEINLDTVWMENITVIPEWTHDTIVKVNNFRDTIRIERVKLVIDCLDSTVYVDQNCPGDTIIQRIPVKIEKTIDCPPCEKGKFWKGFLWGSITSFVLLLALIFLIKK